MRRKHFLLFFIGVVFAIKSSSQNRQIDSLLSLLPTLKNNDTAFVIALSNLSSQYSATGDYETAKSTLVKAIARCEQTHNKTRKIKRFRAVLLNHMGALFNLQDNYSSALEKYQAAKLAFKEINDSLGVAASFNSIGTIYRDQGQYEKSLEFYFKALQIMASAGKKKSASTIMGNIGVIYWYQGNYSKALEIQYKALKIRDSIGAKKEIGDSHLNLGLIYWHQFQYAEARKHFNTALKIYNEFQNKEGISLCYNNLGILSMEEGAKSKDLTLKKNLYEKSLEYYFKSLKIKEELNDRSGIATEFNNMGNTYFSQALIEKDEKLRKSLYLLTKKNHLKAIRIRRQISDKEGVASSLMNLGALDIKLKKFADAGKNLYAALEICKEVGSKSSLRDTYALLQELDSSLGNGRLAYDHFKLFVAYKDSLVNEDNTKTLVSSNLNYEFDKKQQAAKLEQEKKDALAKKEKEKQNIIILSVSVSLILILLLAILVFRNLLKKRAQNRIITQQKELVETQKIILEEKQKEILDSIRYAKRIQVALMPAETLIEKQLKKLQELNPKQN
ncbi:MAG: tetratricopeptide repeat protein [Bacteroidetes bacterium]|nr:tetratricopeptide repeat protein [Bacteroidota bacterium]